MSKTHLQEYDVVTLLEDIAPGLPRGTTGVILLVLDNESDLFEVEFVNEHKESIDTVTVLGRYLGFMSRPSN